MSIPYNIIDEEYRALTAKAQYPFEDTAPLGNKFLSFEPAAFLDALIYASGDFVGPYHISSIEGGFEDNTVMRVTIKDKNRAYVCEGYLQLTTDVCQLKDQYELEAGVLVYDPLYINRALGSLTKNKVEFSPNDLPFLAGVCHTASAPENIAGFKVEGEILKDEVVLIAENGVNFDVGHDFIRINLFGEEHLYQKTVKSINGVRREHYWFVAHPDSAVRVITKSNEISLGTKKELSK